MIIARAFIRSLYYSLNFISHIICHINLQPRDLLSTRCNVTAVRCEKNRADISRLGSRALFTDFRGTSQFQLRSIGNRLLPHVVQIQQRAVFRAARVNLKRSIQSRHCLVKLGDYPPSRANCYTGNYSKTFFSYLEFLFYLEFSWRDTWRGTF